jgi:histidine triad (HIT) family protein
MRPIGADILDGGAAKLPECIFCAIAAGSVKADVVFADGSVVAFRDIAPAAPVHVLVIPRRHVGSLMELDSSDSALLESVHAAIREVARSQGLAASGFRVVVNTGAGAGQSVGHLHYHVLGGRPLAWPPG